MSAIAMSPTDSFSAYMNTIREIPLISREDEHDLAVDYQQNGNMDAAQKLIISHLRFVVYVARKFDGYGLPLAELVQEGNVGLMKAVYKFDPNAGVRLMAYAGQWIRAEINEYIIRNWRIVKVATTKAQRKLFFNLRSQKKLGDWFSAEEVSTIAKELGVKESDIRTMEGRLSARDTIFEKEDDDEDERFDADIYLIDENNSIDQLIEEEHDHDMRQQVLQVVGELSDREQKIIRGRWLIDGKATPLKEFASNFGVSVERVRQIEAAAIAKLKQQLAA